MDLAQIYANAASSGQMIGFESQINTKVEDAVNEVRDIINGSGTVLSAVTSSYHPIDEEYKPAAKKAADGYVATLAPLVKWNFDIDISLQERDDPNSYLWQYANVLEMQFINYPPTDIVLSNNTVLENQPVGTNVGTFSTIDPLGEDTFSYSLVGGDIEFFSIDDNALITASLFDYEFKDSYSVRIRSTDSNEFFIEKDFTVNISNIIEPGSLTVNIDPVDVQTTGQWHLTSGADTSWKDSGDMISVLAGNYTLEFEDIYGWITPLPLAITIPEEALVTENIIYTHKTPNPNRNGDGKVNLIDFSLLANKWLLSGCEEANHGCDGSDINYSGSVGTDDLLIMAEHWLEDMVAEPAGMVFVSINDDGSGMKDSSGNPISHGGFNGEMSRYETTNAQFCEYLNAALASDDIYVGNDDVIYGKIGSNSGDDFPSQVYFDTYAASSYSQITYSNGTFSVRSRDGYSMANHPVGEVSWYGATAFCNYYGYRLPTEWEWQAVADYDGSYTYGCGNIIDYSRANFHDSLYGYSNPLNLSTWPYTSPVGYYILCGYGMFDMAGNVWEWTSTVIGSSGGYRVIRGGGWGSGNYDEYNCTVSDRPVYYPSSSDNSFGFRVCR